MPETPFDPKDRRWHLEVQYRWWVLWGYGAGRQVVHISPANDIVDMSPHLPGEQFTFPFELPKKTGSLPAAREYERVRTWGWTFRTNNMAHDTWWKLAPSKEAAIAAAQGYVENSQSIRRDQKPIFEAALKDVRERVLENEPPQPPKEWAPDRKVREEMGNGSVRHLKLKDLVSDEVIAQLEPVMNDIAEGKLDTGKGQKKLLEVLKPHAQDLLAKGVLADYLAWVLAAAASRGGGHLGSVRVE